MEVLQVQEVMTNEEMTGTMDDYDLNTYPPAKYPATCKKSGKRNMKGPWRRSAPTRKASGQQRRMKVRHKIKLLNGWYLPKRKSYSRRPWKYVNPIKRGTLKKKRTREAIVESVDGRGSPFYLKRRLQKLRRQQKYLIKKNLYPNKERYLPVRKTQNRVNWLWHFCDVKFSEEYIPL